MAIHEARIRERLAAYQRQPPQPEQRPNPLGWLNREQFGGIGGVIAGDNNNNNANRNGNNNNVDNEAANLDIPLGH